MCYPLENGNDAIILTRRTGEETMQLMFRRHLADCLKTDPVSSTLIVTHSVKAVGRKQYAGGLVKWTAE